MYRLLVGQFLAASLTFCSTPSWAIGCSHTNPRYQLDADVVDYINHLICLHNEQSDHINELSAENRLLQFEVKLLSERVEALEYALEDALSE